MSFDTITLWSTLSNALLKSTNKARTEPPLSIKSLTPEVKQRCQNMSGSRTALQTTKLIWIDGRVQKIVEPVSHTRLENLSQDSIKVGRMSEEIDLGGCAGITTAHLQIIIRDFPCLMEPLNIAASGSAISGAKSLSIQLGRCSEPGAL